MFRKFAFFLFLVMMGVPVLSAQTVNAFDGRNLFWNPNQVDEQSTLVTEVPVCRDSTTSATSQFCTTDTPFKPDPSNSITYIAATTNSGTLMLAVNGYGPYEVRKNLGASSLSAGDLPAGKPQIMTYDGTYWNVYTTANGGGGGGTPCVTLDGSLQYSNSGSFGCAAPFSYGNVGGITFLGSLPGSTNTYCDACGMFLSNSNGTGGIFFGIGLAGQSSGTPAVAGVNTGADGGFFIIGPSRDSGTFEGLQDNVGDPVFGAQRSSDASPLGYYLRFWKHLNLNQNIFAVDSFGRIFGYESSDPGSPSAGNWQYALGVDSTTHLLTCKDPSGPGGSCLASGLTLEVGGVPNGSQALLNLAAGSNITLTDNGTGTVTIASTGGGGSTTPGGSNGNFQYNVSGSSFGGVPDLNFDGTHTLILGSSGILTLTAGATLNGFTNAMLPTSGVSATSYTNANITVNDRGIVTAASNGSGGGANTALSNLSAVSINTSLLAQTGVDLGSTTKPFRNLFLWGAGTYGTTYEEITGTPTGTRVWTLQDATDTLVGRATTDTLINKSIAGSEINSSVVGNTYGGTGQNSSSATGVAQVNSGTWSFSTALANGTTATTQSLADNTTKVATDAFVIANAGTFNSPMTTLGDLIYENATPVAARLPGPTGVNGIPYILTETPSSGPQAPAWLIPGVATDLQTGTSYSIPITDNAHFVGGNNVSATAWTGFSLANNYVFSFMNLNTGLITYTPNSGFINVSGHLTQIIPQNYFGFHYTDNTNTYMPVMPTIAAFPNCVDSTGNHLNFTAATGVWSCGTSIPASPTFTAPNIGAATATSLLATGIVDGKAPLTVTTGSSASLGGTFNSGYTYNQEATAGTAIVYTLPTAAAGKQYCIGNSYNGSAGETGTLKLITSASGQFIIYNGVLSLTNGYIISAGALGDKGCAVGVDSTHWEFYAQVGTWTLH